MANRSYLYSTNIIPGPNAKAEDLKLIGISEWNYDIPIVFKLLLSGNPKTCPSSIWDSSEEIALIGDYELGVKNLEIFLSKVTSSSAQTLITEAKNFLSNPENKNQYFVLECGEIFDMGDAPILEQNLEFLEQIKNLQPEMDEALRSLLPPPVESKKPVGFFAKLLGRTQEPQHSTYDPMKSIYALGLGNWSNILYFDFSEA